MPPQATGADIGGGAMAGAATTENSEDPGKITYNLLLKNELLGAGVNRMLVCHNIGAIDPTHTHTHTHTLGIFLLNETQKETFS